MRLSAPMLVIMWAAANGGLVLILRGYLGTGIELACYGTAVGIATLFGLALALSRGRVGAERTVYYIPRSALPAVLIAFGVGIWALGLAFFPWPLVVGWVPLVAGALLAAKDRVEKEAVLPGEPPAISGTSAVARAEVPTAPPPPERPLAPLLAPPPVPAETTVAALRTLVARASEPARPVFVRRVAAAAGAAAVAAAAVAAARLGRARERTQVPLDAETVRRILQSSIERDEKGRPPVAGRRPSGRG